MKRSVFKADEKKLNVLSKLSSSPVSASRDEVRTAKKCGTQLKRSTFHGSPKREHGQRVKPCDSLQQTVTMPSNNRKVRQTVLQVQSIQSGSSFREERQPSGRNFDQYSRPKCTSAVKLQSFSKHSRCPEPSKQDGFSLHTSCSSSIQKSPRAHDAHTVTVTADDAASAVNITCSLLDLWKQETRNQSNVKDVSNVVTVGPKRTAETSVTAAESADVANEEDTEGKTVLTRSIKYPRLRRAAKGQYSKVLQPCLPMPEDSLMSLSASSHRAMVSGESENKLKRFSKEERDRNRSSTFYHLWKLKKRGYTHVSNLPGSHNEIIYYCRYLNVIPVDHRSAEHVAKRCTLKPTSEVVNFNGLVHPRPQLQTVIERINAPGDQVPRET